MGLYWKLSKSSTIPIMRPAREGSLTMVEVKEMPYTEKYERVLDGLKHDEYVPGFIEKHLGPGGFRRVPPVV